MSIVKPFTFTAGTKARANEVNDNFDVLYSQINSNITEIENNAEDIDELTLNKANINGNSTQRFSVADPISNSDAINKQSMFEYIGNTIDYIGGLTISKDSGNPNNAILVTPGAAYDSTHTIVLTLTGNTTKTNTTQAANATYYVYIIGNSTGSSIDILISTSGTTPTLPSGYTLFRRIGYYTTNSSSNIDTIYNTGLNTSIPSSVSNPISYYSSGDTGYMVFSSGLKIQWGKVYNMGNNSAVTVTLPKSFNSTNYCVAGSASYDQTSGDKRSSWSTRDYNNGSFIIASRFEQSNANIFWIAIGV